jgi:ABC-2 type transport system permease protein
MTAIAAPPRTRGEIHDLGYSRYVGPRRAPSTRWRVIMRHQIATAWKTWWRYKAAIGLAVMFTAVFGGIMYFFSNRQFEGMAYAQGLLLTYRDTTLPLSIVWFCRAAFYLSLTLGAGVIAGDVESGAFTLYFARSIRPRDYVLGKLAGYTLLVATLTVIGPCVLALLRLGMSATDSLAEVVDHLWMVPAALAVGACAMVAYAVIPLAFSALVRNRRYAFALWAGWYLVLGSLVSSQRVAFGSFAAIDLPTSIEAITYELFDFHPTFTRKTAWHLSPTAAAISLGIQVLVGIVVIWRQVVRAHASGVGGGS